MRKLLVFLSALTQALLVARVANAEPTNSISPGQILCGSITAPLQTNYYTFTASANDVVSVAVLRTNGPGTFPYFEVYDPMGNFAFKDANGPSSTTAYAEAVPLTKTGTYTIRVSDNNANESFSYLLNLTQVACGANQREAEDGAEAILPGQITGGHIGPADLDTYCFTANANDVVSVVLLRTNGAIQAPYFRVYNPNGSFAFEDPNGPSTTTGYAEAVRLTNTGSYTIVVRDDQLDSSWGYQLSFIKIGCGVNQREADDAAEPNLPGQITGGHIGPADLDTYCFTANANDVVSVVLLRTNGAIQAPYFRVYNPNGSFAFEDPNGPSTTTGYAEAVRLTNTGNYTIVVRDAQLDSSWGYQLSLIKVGCGLNQREPDDATEVIVPGEITGGHIGPADLDTYCFAANSNDVVSVVLLRTNGAVQAPYFMVYNPSGRFAFEDPNGPTTNVGYAEAVRLTNTGNYTIVVRDAQLDSSWGYSLCMIKVPGPNLPEPGEGPELLLAGETRLAQITAGDLDAYTFDVIAGDTVWITLTRTSGAGQISAQVYGTNGNVLVNTNSANALQIRLPCSTNTGLYTIACGDDGRTQPFAYNITLLQDPGPPPSSDPEHPYLAIFRCTTNTVVRWPTNAAGFELIHRDNVILGSWSNVPPPYAVIANHYYVTNRSADSMRYYKLRRP